jgi:Zn-dependent protease
MNTTSPDQSAASGTTLTTRAKLLAIGALGWSKAGAIVAALAKFKFLVVAGSMGLSLATYGWMWGWSAGAVFIYLLFVHEMGHVLVNKRLGIPASAPYFIPFLGAIIALKKYPKNVEEEAWAALGGPVLGTVAALSLLPLWLLTGSHLWVWGMMIGAGLNLFNLIPVSPLDGGRIVGAISRHFWLLGLAVLVGLGLYLQETFLIFVAMMALLDISRRYCHISWKLWAVATVALAVFGIYTQHPGDVGVAVATGYISYRFWQRRDEESQPLAHDESYFEISRGKRILIAVLYLGLAFFLMAMLVWIASLNVIK